MFLNHEYSQRVSVASHYKAAAFSYIREALFLYLEWKQETELSSSSFSPISNNPSYPSFSETPSERDFLRRAQDPKEEKGVNLDEYAQIQMILLPKKGYLEMRAFSSLLAEGSISEGAR